MGGGVAKAAQGLEPGGSSPRSHLRSCGSAWVVAAYRVSFSGAASGWRRGSGALSGYPGRGGRGPPTRRIDLTYAVPQHQQTISGLQTTACPHQVGQSPYRAPR